MDGGGEQYLRHRDAERLCGLYVDDQLELARLLNRDIAGLRPTQDFVDHVGSLPE